MGFAILWRCPLKLSLFFLIFSCGRNLMSNFKWCKVLQFADVDKIMFWVSFTRNSWFIHFNRLRVWPYLFQEQPEANFFNTLTPGVHKKVIQQQVFIYLWPFCGHQTSTFLWTPDVKGLKIRKEYLFPVQGNVHHRSYKFTKIYIQVVIFFQFRFEMKFWSQRRASSFVSVSSRSLKLSC